MASGSTCSPAATFARAPAAEYYFDEVLRSFAQRIVGELDVSGLLAAQQPPDVQVDLAARRERRRLVRVELRIAARGARPQPHRRVRHLVAMLEHEHLGLEPLDDLRRGCWRAGCRVDDGAHLGHLELERRRERVGRERALRRVLSAGKPASSASGGEAPPPAIAAAPAVSWKRALVGVPNSAASSTSSSPGRARFRGGLRPGEPPEPPAGEAGTRGCGPWGVRTDTAGRLE